VSDQLLWQFVEVAHALACAGLLSAYRFGAFMNPRKLKHAPPSLQYI